MRHPAHPAEMHCDDESTPLQSPSGLHNGHPQEQRQEAEKEQAYANTSSEASNYFPTVVQGSPDGSDEAVGLAREPTSHLGADSSRARDEQRHSDEDSSLVTEQPTPTLSTPETEDEGIATASPLAGNGVMPRRASFRDPKTPKSELLDIPPASNSQRGASLDIPRPVIDLSTQGGEGEGTEGIVNGRSSERDTPRDDQDLTASTKEDSSLAAPTRTDSYQSQGSSSGLEDNRNGNETAKPATKRSPWNLAWLKK